MNDDTDDERVKWDCFSCGKHLGEQGLGGSFVLHFGYGSRLDSIQGISGWICDECVAQKHERLRVSNGSRGLAHWFETNMVPLTKHEDTQHFSLVDFHGRRQPPGVKRELEGWRLYDSITAEERSRIEAALFKAEPVDSDLIVKLFQCLMESEAARAEAVSRCWRAERNAWDRARQQAERLSAEDLARLRVREHKNNTPEDIARIWEHAEWNETHFRELQEKNDQLRSENAALKQRVAWYEGEGPPRNPHSRS